MTISRHYVLAAGGTGGHLIPAYALARELQQRGHHIALVTDERGAKIPGIFEGDQVHILPPGRIAGGPIGWLRGIRGIWAGRAMALNLFENFQPSAVIGFGGYPALPTLLAAQKARIPTIIHEQNAVLGRVNASWRAGQRDRHRLQAGRPAEPEAQGARASGRNPVRDEVLSLRGENYPPLLEDGVFRVLVTGGSQGARVLSDVVPDGLAMLPVNLRRRLQVVQQCREEDIEGVRAKYAEHGIPAELATYMNDLPEKLGWSHLFIGRAGASTIAELTVAGRPAILVPLPIATDDHQTATRARWSRPARSVDPAGGVHAKGTGQADPENGARPAGARERGARRAQMRLPQCGARSGRSRRELRRRAAGRYHSRGPRRQGPGPGRRGSGPRR